MLESGRVSVSWLMSEPMCSGEAAMRASKVKLLDLLSDQGLRAIETKTEYFSTRITVRLRARFVICATGINDKVSS